MKGLCASLAGGLLAWTSASAAIMGDLPDATHAWAVHDPNRPRPPVVTVGANGVPSDAIVLFDGSERTYRETWVSSKEGHGEAPWTLADGVITSHDGSIETKRAFGDCQLHVEWCAPDDENPQHGNSGVYLMGLYEVQIINSHEIAPGKYHKIIRSADEQAACVYGQKPPLVNPIRKPGEWQTYDIIFHQPIHDEKGALVHPGTMTILFNGVLVQDNREIEGPTLYCTRTTDKVHPDRGPLRLQDHNGNVRFRNIWIRELKSPWTEDVVSGTSVVSTNAVRAQRKENARKLLDGLKDIPDAYDRLVSALEMLSYSLEEPFLSAATALADAEAEALPKYAKEVREKHVSQLQWYFEKMFRGGCLPRDWKLYREVYRDPSDPVPEKVTEKIELFNGKDLTNWYTWIRTYGKNNDPKGVFTVTNGVIRVYGPEGYNGCITTERSFRDYRLVVEFRYTGELFGKKLATNAAPDSGILFHSTGKDGAFYDTWMSSWEYNLIVGANGDFWSVIDGRPGREFRPDMQLTARGVRKFIGGEKYPSFVYDPNGAETHTLRLGCDHVYNSHVVPTYRNRAGDPVQDCEKPVGEWNVAELICDGDKATCILNGVVVNVGENIYPDYGRIQLQNESCGCEFRRITLYPLESAVAAAQGQTAGERLVKRTDFDVPSTWAQKTVMGHEFLPCFSKEYWTADRTKPDRPSLGIYDECVDALHGRSEVGYFSRLREGRPSKTNYAVENPVETVCKGEYTFEQAMGAKRLANLDQPGRGKYPFFFQLPYDRPSFLLDAEYASRQDRAGYRAWRARHPNCLGAHTLGEYDQQAMWYRAFSSSTSNKQVLAQLRADFPFPPKGTSEPILQRDWFRKWVMESFRREREYCFGETDIWTLHSGCPSLAHIMSEAGGAGFFYECTPQGPGSWTIPGAFSRGASRQYGVPFGWYVANFITAYTRDGKAASGEESRALNPVRGYAAFGRDRGASRSLIRRQMAYGWLTGACLLEPENWYHYHREEYEQGKYRPSVYAEDLQELVDRAKTTDRGVPYTPVAILVPMWERCQRGYWNRDICDPWSMSAFFLTLEPVEAEQNDKPYDLQRRNGDEACFFNSPFGGIYDVVCPDATRNRENIARTLGAYKAAFVAGDFRKEELPEGALENYVREGGTLFISADKLAKGIVSPAFAGVAFGSETVLSAAPLKAKYSLFKPTGTPVAVPLTKDGNGNVIVWSRDVGRGRIVTVACDRMLPDDYAKCAHGDYKARLLEAMSPGFRFEVIRGLLKRVQRETVPVTVEGDVQWGVNRTKSGWLVWMFNNKGVRKFVGEPEELDPSKTAHVTVRCGDEVKTADVPPGGVSFVAFDGRRIQDGLSSVLGTSCVSRQLLL